MGRNFCFLYSIEVAGIMFVTFVMVGKCPSIFRQITTVSGFLKANPCRCRIFS